MRISKMTLVALATFSASCSGSSPHPVGHVGSSSPSTAPKISAAPSASPETPLTRARGARSDERHQPEARRPGRLQGRPARQYEFKGGRRDVLQVHGAALVPARCLWTSTHRTSRLAAARGQSCGRTTRHLLEGVQQVAVVAELRSPWKSRSMEHRGGSFR